MARLLAFLFGFLASGQSGLVAADFETLIAHARSAEAALNSARALELYLDADRARPNNPIVLQKIAQQYSDLVVEQTDDRAGKQFAQTALDYAQRAASLDPQSAVNVLSLAVCYGKLALYSDTRTKLEYSRLVKSEAERALALDPRYAWAHHVLGRWHLELASLGNTKRFFVRLIYGELPPASVEQAIGALERAVELEPDELAHQLELGFAYLGGGQKTKARAQFRAGLAMPSRKKHDDAAKSRARVALAALDTD
jgi:tetratricopeptide (TPR) repeat protein